jgi:hypothetical protein
MQAGLKTRRYVRCPIQAGLKTRLYVRCYVSDVIGP